MMRVCIDAAPTENAHRGRGIGTVAREVLRALDGLTPAPGSSIRYFSRQPLLGIDRLQWTQRGTSAEFAGIDQRIPPLLSAIWQAFEAARVFPGEISRSGCDVFLATDPFAIARSQSFRTVAIVYDLIPVLFADEYLSGFKRVPRRALLEIGLARLRRVDRVVAISEATRQDVISLLGIPSDRVDVAHLAVDRDVFRPRGDEGRRLVRARFGLDGPYFLYVGEFDARKNIDGLVEAFDRTASSHSTVKLVLAGASARSRALLERRLPSRFLSRQRIVFAGHVSVEELSSLYSSAVALAYPSRYEGFGLPVLEAMSCGTPVLTAPVSALPEIAGDAAVYANPDDSDEVSAALTRLLSDSALRNELSRRGLERAARFSWRDTAVAILAACGRAASMPPAS